MRKRQLYRIWKRIVVWVSLITLCLFFGNVASVYSQKIIMFQDYTTKDVEGIVSYCGFPIWWKGTAPGYSWADFRPERYIANWLAWTAVFMFICFGLCCIRIKRKNKASLSIPLLFMKIPTLAYLVGIILFCWFRWTPLAWEVSFLRISLEDSKKARHEKIQAERIEKLSDKALLMEIVRNDEARTVRHAALKQLRAIRCEEIAQLDDQTLLAEIARNDPDYIIRKEAVSNLGDHEILAEIAVNDESEWVRAVAVVKISNQTVLAEIAENDQCDYVRQMAEKQLHELASMPP